MYVIKLENLIQSLPLWLRVSVYEPRSIVSIIKHLNQKFGSGLIKSSSKSWRKKEPVLSNTRHKFLWSNPSVLSYSLLTSIDLSKKVKEGNSVYLEFKGTVVVASVRLEVEFLKVETTPSTDTETLTLVQLKNRNERSTDVI